MRLLRVNGMRPGGQGGEAEEAEAGGHSEEEEGGFPGSRTLPSRTRGALRGSIPIDLFRVPPNTER